MRFTRLFRLCLVLAIAALAGCGEKKQSARWTVGMSQCNLGEPWRVQMNADLKRAADAHPELRVVFKDAQNDSLKQRAQIEEFISSGVDLLIVSPKEAAPLTPPVAAAYKADGVIHYGLQFCQPYLMESIPVEKALEEDGIPCLRIDTDYSMEDAGQLKTRIEAFIEQLR